MSKQNPSEASRPEADSRRRFVKKAAYLAPVVLTLPTALGAAQFGSAAACGPGGIPCDS